MSLVVCLGMAVAAEPTLHHSALLLSGFGVQWDKRPHRVRALGFGVRATGSDGPPEGTLWTHVQGGKWADGATAKDVPRPTVLYAGLQSTERSLYAGSSTVEVRGDRKSGGRETMTVRVPDGAPAGAVWLRGFQLHSGEEHPVGYTMHEVAVQLGPVTSVDGGLEFELSVALHAAGVPDRVQQLKTYSARFDVDWLVVPSEEGRVARHTASAVQKSGMGLAEGEDAASRERVPLEWSVSADDVVAGLSGFRVDVANEGPVDGRYWRSLDVQLVGSDHDPHRGRWDGLVELRFANGGPVTRKLRVELEASVTTLALAPGEHRWGGRWTPVLGEPGAVEEPYGAAPAR